MTQENGIHLNFDCLKGETIFHSSFCIKHNVNPSKINRLSSELMEAISYYHMLDDDRLIALVGELIVENALESYLSASLKGYQKEFSNSNISPKIRIAKALNLSPPIIFECADIIRDIRNEFAHHLDTTNFDSITKEKTNRIKDALLRINDKMAEKRNLRENFTILTIDTTMALQIFTKDAHLLNSYLRSDNFQKNLLEYSKTIEGNKS